MLLVVVVHNRAPLLLHLPLVGVCVPLARAEEMYCVEHIQVRSICRIYRPNLPVRRVNSRSKCTPLCHATNSLRPPEEDYRLAIPVQKRGVVSILRQHSLQLGLHTAVAGNTIVSK